MSTTRRQRIGIWVIVVALTVGTIGTFLALIYGTQNQQVEQARRAELEAAYQKEYETYQEKVTAQVKALSDQYYDELSQYASRATAFDAATVTELGKEDLKVGDGADITATSDFSAYYIGWNPSGKIFDSSMKDGALLAPLSVGPNGTPVIEGWTQGADGMKVGGIRLLSIPSDLAYKEMGSGEDIPPNTPIKFVLMIVPTPETIEIPQPSAELLKLWGY
jgi:FKBP-type peptidyl-prolyl cis-trans isomerase FkpA